MVRAAILRSRERTELGEGLLDWVEIGAIGPQTDQARRRASIALRAPRDLVTTEIVKNDNIGGASVGATTCST